MTRIDTIRAHVAAYPDSDWSSIAGLPGWLAKVDGDRVALHVPVVYADPEHPGRGYADDYSDLPAPYDASANGAGECWCYDHAALMAD